MPPRYRLLPIALIPLGTTFACSRASERTPSTATPTAGAPAAQPPRGIWAGYVTASATPEGIAVVNQTERAVFYTAFAKELLALVRWYPCVDPARCASVAPGGRVTVPWDQVSGYEPQRKDYVFYWWQGIPAEGGTTRADSVRAIPLTR